MNEQAAKLARVTGDGDSRDMQTAVASTVISTDAGSSAAPAQPYIGPPRLALQAPPVTGAVDAVSVTLTFSVEPDSFELGRDGRACFVIWRAPLGVLEDTGELYHNRKDEAVYVPQTCFSRIQDITAASTPHGT